MTRFLTTLALVGPLLAAASLGLSAPQAGNGLEALYSRVDHAAAAFKSLTADIRQQSHTEVVNADAVDEGTITVKRVKPKDTRILIEIKKPDPKIYQIGEGKFRMYNLKTKEAQEADLDKNSRDIVNQFMLLAFGSNSAELQSAYTIKLGGPDTVNGQQATRIEMVPKSQEILKHVKRCDLWISEQGMTIQQKFFQTGGDYVLATYTRMTVNPNIPDSAVKLDLPKGTKIEKLK